MTRFRALAWLATVPLLTAGVVVGAVGTAGAALEYPVGVIADGNGCPGQADPSTRFVIQDDEDDRNENRHDGWIGGVVIHAPSTSFPGAHATYIPLCLVDGTRFTGMLAYQVNFAVLRLGSSCPPGARAFDRYVDDEDNGGQPNHDSNNLPPGGTSQPGGRNTTFRFCWFVNTAGSPAPLGSFPNLGGRYDVFGPNASYAYDHGSFHTDDEDTDNENSLTPEPNPLISALRGQVLVADRNTTYRMIRVTT
jgi:hypothetical protein